MESDRRIRFNEMQLRQRQFRLRYLLTPDSPTAMFSLRQLKNIASESRFPTLFLGLEGMEYSSESGALFETVAPLVRGLGFEIVVLIGKQRTGMFHVNLVVHGAAGVDIGATTNIYKVVYPRLTVAMDTEDIHLEVSSPGIFRKFKDAREFAIFSGLKVKILTESGNDWLVGNITDATDIQVTIDSGGTARSIPYRDITKAQLEYP